MLNNKGFTLIDILIISAIVGIMGTVVVASKYDDLQKPDPMIELQKHKQ